MQHVRCMHQQEPKMSNDDLEIFELGKATERLLMSSDFQKVILETFIDKQTLDTGKAFYGSQGEIDKLKGITMLDGFIKQSVEDARIVQNQNKGN